jgi:malate/lactate dehydrogenase
MKIQKSDNVGPGQKAGTDLQNNTSDIVIISGGKRRNPDMPRDSQFLSIAF